jgi:type VI secretion system protein ImpJ
MLLHPQHLQQHDRYIERLIQHHASAYQPYNWGFYSLTLDHSLLQLGQFAIQACEGVLADGTPFNLPVDDDLPVPLEIPKDTRNEFVFLSLPLRQTGKVETDSETYAAPLARYRMQDYTVRDNNSNFESIEVRLPIGKLQTRLLLGSDDRAGYINLAVARIIEVQSDNRLIIDESFIPANLNSIAMPALLNAIRTCSGLLNAKGEALSSHLGVVGYDGMAEINVLLLQLINRHQVLFDHFANLPGLHPEACYRSLLQLVGELSTFSPAKRPQTLPPYDHEALQLTFSLILDLLQDLLIQSEPSRAVKLELENPRAGVFIAKQFDRSLVDHATFVLAVHAQLPPKQLQSDFARLVKISPVEVIQQIVEDALPGLPIESLPQVPRHIPYYEGYLYFKLGRHPELWDKMKDSAGFAIFITRQFPDLALEFWAARDSLT